MMEVASMSRQTIEMEAILGLAPVKPVGREELERATMEVERVLDDHVLEITGGASASANFETGHIEIDLVLTGATMSELYQKVALIVTQLDRYCDSMLVAPLSAGAANLPTMEVQGSQMRRIAHEPDPLVPA
jgi:hypothetical protein